MDTQSAQIILTVSSRWPVRAASPFAARSSRCLVAYGVGAVGGRLPLRRDGRYVLTARRAADRADRFFARHGDLVIVVTRLVPLARTVIALPAGIVRMRLSTFAPSTVLGSRGWCFTLASTGYTLGRNAARVGGVRGAYTLVVVAAILALVAATLYQHARHVEPDDGDSDGDNGDGKRHAP